MNSKIDETKDTRQLNTMGAGEYNVNLANLLTVMFEMRGKSLMGRKKGIPGFSFSWKRASGLSAAKSKISKKTGIPLTRSGRQRKMGKAMGCCIPLAFLAIAFSGAIFGIFQWLA